MANPFEESEATGPLNKPEEHVESGKLRTAAEMATAEDYEKSLSVIKQLEAAAADESTFEKVANQVLRIADRGVIGILYKLDTFSAVFPPGIHTYTDLGIVNEDHKRRLEEAKNRFRDAQKKLEDMMKTGQYGEIETEQEK